jgi:tripartite-type tricarboxylate transporter receptor subunit TctC
MKKFRILSTSGVRSLHTALFCLCALSLAPLASQAQDYPNQPIRTVVPYPPGGPTDLLVRPVALKMGVGLGQTFVIDNKGGASGTIGSAEVARAKADGYTILANASLHVIAPLVQTNLRYDAIESFEPIT